MTSGVNNLLTWPGCASACVAIAEVSIYMVSLVGS